MYIEKGYTLGLAKAVKKEINIPLIVTGSRLDEPGLLLAAVAEDTADAVGLGRASVADPFLPRKYETGRIEEVKPCIDCNKCIETALQGGNLHCAVNPAVTREELVKLTPSLTPKKVVIVGGGQVGSEIAIDLSRKGKDITVVELLDAVLSSAAPIAMINKMALMKLYEKEKIKVLTSARLDSVDDQGANVTLLKEDRTVKIEADTVIVSVGMKALASMAPDLQGQGFEVYEIGDGVQVGDVHTTIYSAFNVARNI